MNQYARSGLFHEYMRKEQFNQSINDDIKQISMTGYRSKQKFALVASRATKLQLKISL
ncbi:hypothetical protein [Pseudoalteromonas sp. Z9A6]|uniref:hypothetical protein n=1 Tax=Pseudoalteromonas sp. Z9A6 TaxID=2686352 RepID=UPI0013FE0AD7|nr:hypothetical protein [Pseudoalteromonas sp. Z9A6]